MANEIVLELYLLSISPIGRAPDRDQPDVYRAHRRGPIFGGYAGLNNCNQIHRLESFPLARVQQPVGLANDLNKQRDSSKSPAQTVCTVELSRRTMTVTTHILSHHQHPSQPCTFIPNEWWCCYAWTVLCEPLSSRPSIAFII
jgi:hypothetical protein